MGMQHLLKTAEFTDDVICMDDDTLRRMQDLLLSMLKDFSDGCTREGIAWCLSGGSVIGAVRHGGFIPWDDDVDVFLERAEFDRLAACFDRVFGDRYELKKPGDSGYYLPYPRICRRGTALKTIQSSPKSSGGGIPMDIFLLESTYDCKFRRTLHGIICTALLFVESAIRTAHCRENILHYTRNNAQLKKEVDKRARWAFLFRLFRNESWFAFTDRVFSRVRKKGKYVVAPGGGKHFFGEVYERAKIVPYSFREFCGETFPVPRDPDYYLQMRFGSGYMTPPPEDQREKHRYIEVKFLEKAGTADSEGNI